MHIHVHTYIYTHTYSHVDTSGIYVRTLQPDYAYAIKWHEVAIHNMPSCISLTALSASLLWIAPTAKTSYWCTCRRTQSHVLVYALILIVHSRNPRISLSRLHLAFCAFLLVHVDNHKKDMSPCPGAKRLFVVVAF